MSQPNVSERYIPSSTSCSSSPPTISTFSSSSSSSPPPPESTSPRNANQRPRLHGPSNASNSLSPPPNMISSSDTGTSSFKAPARLTSASSSSLSPPALSKKNAKAHSTSTPSQSPSPPPLSSSSTTTASLTPPDERQDDSGKTISGVVADSGASPRPAMRASEIAVTTQPPPVGQIQTGESATAQGTPAPSTEPAAKTSTPTPGPSNQIPTIAQRDALASRVYSVCRSAGHANWLHLLDLSPLASQHHLSGYNCMKFGHQGSPYAYFPLSLQQPWQADAMIEKQRLSEIEAIKWLEQKRSSKSKVQQAKDRGPKRGGGLLEEDGSRAKDIPQDDQAGIEFVSSHHDDSEMKDASPKPGKASDDDLKVDGPITNHRAIDQEYEAPFTKSNQGQTIEEKEAEIRKAEEDAASPSQQSAQAIKTSDTHPISISAVIPPELLIEFTHYVEKGLPDGVRQEVRSNGGLSEIVLPEHCSKQIEEKRLIQCRTTNVDLCDVAQKAEKEMIDAAQSKRRARPLAFQDSWKARRNPTDTSYLQITYKDYEEGSDDGVSDVIPVAFGGHYRGFTIGNLLLSSCPGKKVRLTGPVRGRGAICRNLGLDLARIKQLGVGALICCLDDEELTFLGAPWTLYEKEADRLGIEVIRLPMAEGFCPTDVTLTDNIITSVVEQYTLRGVNILVHCRGGVGRAGLVACTWMVKLGLVQSPDESPSLGEDQNKTIDQVKEERNREDMMKLCRRLIDTIRKRRSPKAIETAEQVAFLIKYITFIRGQEAQRWQQSAQSVKA